MAESSANHHSLQGRNVTIDYSLTDISGQPQLNFKVNQRSGTARKKDMHIASIDNVGQLITFSLHCGPSGDEGEAAFDTIRVETMTTRQGPAHQRYTSVALKRKPSFVEACPHKPDR